MKKKNTLKVKPLRKYNTPVYPSYLDKNPIDHPDTLPYPFSYKALQALTAAGILVGVSCNTTKTSNDSTTSVQPTRTEQGPVTNLPTTNSDAPQDSLSNPFSFESMGVPFMPAMFGTGMPSRLTSEEARETINRVFREEGIKLKSNYKYKQTDLNVTLDGYDANQKIGYVWVDYSKMSAGMVDGWVVSPYRNHHDAEIAIILDEKKYVTNSIDFLQSMINNGLSEEEDKDLVAAYSKRFHQVDLLTNEDDKLATYKELYLDMFIQKEQISKKSRLFLTHKITESSTNKEKETACMNWIMRKNYDQNTQKVPNKETFDKIFNSIIEIDDLRLKDKRFRALSTFITLAHDNPPKRFFTTDVQQMEQNIRDYSTGTFDGAITLSEAKKLDTLPDLNDDFIAPISQRDPRFQYYYNMETRLTKEEEEQLEKIKASGTQEEYEKAQIELLNNDEIISPELSALKALENQVRQYIRWAKQQGGY